MRRPYHVLALLPVVGIVGAPWFANRIEPRILGVPFLLAWIVTWVLLSSVIMWYIGARDGAAERDSGP